MGRILYSNEISYEEENNGGTADPVQINSGPTPKGTLPDCLSGEEIERKLRAMTGLDFGKQETCSCGNHLVTYVRIPEEIWPENWLKRVRVSEKSRVCLAAMR